jgi:hypothetical protein
VRRVGGVVLDPQLAEAEALGEPVGLQERRPPRGKHPLRRGVDGQEVGIAPQGIRAGRDSALERVGIDVGPLGIRDLERAEAALADVTRVERVGGLAFLAAKRLWRHI